MRGPSKQTGGESVPEARRFRLNGVDRHASAGRTTGDRWWAILKFNFHLFTRIVRKRRYGLRASSARPVDGVSN